MRLRNAIGGLILGLGLGYGGVRAEEAPYMRQVEVPIVSEAVDPNVIITADGPVSVTNRRAMTPEEFGALFGPEPDNAAAKAVLTAGANPILTEGELEEIAKGVTGKGRTLNPYLKLDGTLGLKICTGKEEGSWCAPCIPGERYHMETLEGGIINLDCPDQKAAKAGVPACNTLYENHGTCLDDVLAGAFGLTEKTQNGSCAGKNTACYDVSKAKKFATDEDLQAVVKLMGELSLVVKQNNENVQGVMKIAAELSAGQDGLEGRVGGHTDEITALKTQVGNVGVPSLEWGLAIGYTYNGNNGGELGFAIGAPIVGNNGHLDFVARGYLLKNTTTNSYDVVLPTATQSTVDKDEVRKYLDTTVRFRWDLLDGRLNPGVELGLGWQNHTNYRAITLLGETRNMKRSENEFVGVAGVGANGRIYGPFNWYLRLEGDTKRKGAAAAGLEFNF